MPNLGRLSTTTQDQILLALYALAKVKVEELVPGCYREEVVHELAAVWLERLRAGGWDLPREEWEEFVVEEIRKRRVEDYRARKRTLARDGLHLRIISDAPREWMSQDLKIEEERFRGFLDTVRATLPAKCVKAHAMIRDDQLTYTEVAKKLRVPERCVHEYVKTVHRKFRAALRSVGIAAPKLPRGGRSKATADVNVSTRGGAESTLDVNVLARGDCRSTSDVNESTRDDNASTAAITASTRRGFESTSDVNTSTRDDRESTTAVRASTRGDFVSTLQVNTSTRRDLESTRDDFESTRRDLESTRRDPESTSDDFESTRGDFESTLRDFESTRRDLESTCDVNASTRDDEASIGAVCSAPAPVREATRGESETPSTLRDGTRTVSDATASALSVTSVV